MNVVAEASLFVRSGSLVEEETLAVFVTYDSPAARARTKICGSLCESGPTPASVPRSQLTRREYSSYEHPAVASMNLSPGGSGSETPTFSAASGPLFFA